MFSDKFILLLIVTLRFFLVINGGGETTCQKVTVIREILSNGFHRDLLTKVELAAVEHTAGCGVIFKEHLPRGLYVDPYQLTSLQQHNVTEVLLLDHIDVEAPEYLSLEHTLLVYAKPDPECDGCFSATVPIHTRYHRPSEQHEEALVNLLNPQLLVRCNTGLLLKMCQVYPEEDAPCSVKDSTTCRWTGVMFKPVPELILQVPVGLKQHELVVCTVTFLATLFSSVFVLAAVWKYGQFYI
ncbi:GPI alpha-1,4-mannosyltransferase I, stabilizing subunit [Microcaecilia unicolor]|uniref:Phosphatidylinositol-glycan biosynthesis class X protein n=1 Tax=Microcaecilia unicolor TaxID=1415580 RepID=A0A6P7Z9H0_9AMPH|nr:phosphatidylinositol-glycan biosynthesis class X protein [Microcaecilia unicolor]